MVRILRQTFTSNYGEFLVDIEIIYVHNTNNLSDNLLEFN